MQGKLSKNFFLISFIPAIAYWYLEEHYPLRIAVMGGMILALIEMSVEWLWTRHVHTLSKFNFFLIAFLGGLSLIGDEGIWFKLQPAITGLGIGGFLFYRLLKGRGLLLEMMSSMQNELPPEFIIKGLEKHLAFLFLIYGTFMIFVATTLETSQWLFFKTIGFYIVFAFFMLFEFLWMRRGFLKLQENKIKAEVIKNFRP
jgi:intracellular septation protein